jgi:hypothetical protein
MSNTNTGGPAFPSQREHTTKEGMTLRDYFAAKAMEGLMSRTEQGGFDFGRYPDDAKRVALWAYDLAEEMLKAREA